MAFERHTFHFISVTVGIGNPQLGARVAMGGLNAVLNVAATACSHTAAHAARHRGVQYVAARDDRPHTRLTAV